MPRRTERAVFAATVLLLHLLLWWAWPRQAPPSRGTPLDAAASPTLPMQWLVIVAAPAEQALPPVAAAPTRVIAPRTAMPVRESSRRAQQPLAITMPAALPPEPAASTPPALDLTLPSAAAAPPSPSLRHQWLNDPRTNSPRVSVESRVAALNGPDRWEAEPMDATRTRWRRNGRCIEVHVARNAQIDPYNQSFSPTPKAVKPYCD